MGVDVFGEGYSASAELDGSWGVERTDLHARYLDYRLRQGRRLAALLPREAVRPIYRAAIAANPGADWGTDALELFAAYCARLMPLPPFEIWLRDLWRSPDAYLDDLDDSVDGPTSTRPLTLGARALRYGGDAWEVSFKAFFGDGAWRGYLYFEPRREATPCRTTVIFCEPTVRSLLERFTELEPPALGAFLRSALR